MDGTPGHHSLLQLLYEAGEVFARQQGLLVNLQKPKGNSKKNFASFIEDSISDPQHSLSWQYLRVKTDKPLGSKEWPRHAQLFNMFGKAGQFSGSQLFEHLEISEEARHGGCVVIGQLLLQQGFQKPEGGFLLLGDQQKETSYIIQALAVTDRLIAVGEGQQDIVQVPLHVVRLR